MGTDSPGRRTIARLAIAVVAALAVIAAAPGAAGAASIAYIDGGEVWLSSLDGQQKVRLATPVVNADGETEKWLAVAASDSGRIVAARNVPGRIARLSWFKVWEPNGASTVEGPLNAPSGWADYVYPLGFDVTADGTAHGLWLLEQQLLLSDHLRAGDLCPARDQQLARSDRRLRPGAPDAVRQPDHRPHWRDGERAGRVGRPVRDGLHALDRRLGDRTRPPPHGRRGERPARRTRAGAVERRDADDRQDRRVGDPGGRSSTPTFPAAVDCFMPTSGVAKDVSLSLDATRIAWTDDGGLKVAGSPTTAADPCAAHLAARRDLADRLAGRDRRGGRGRVPAHVRSAADRRHSAVGRAGGDRAEEGHREGVWPAPEGWRSRSRSPARAR